MKKLANPKKIVMPITFLASDVTSYITGETLVVDGVGQLSKFKI